MDLDNAPVEATDAPSLSETYFANLPEPELSEALMDKVETFYRYYDTNGRFKLLDKSYRCYHGMPFNSVTGDASEITKSGTRNELANIRVNHYRNLILHQLSLVTNELPVPKAVCSQTDHTTIGQAMLGDGVVDHYRRKLHLDAKIRELVANAIKYTSGYIVRDWDSNLGDVYPAQVEGQPQQMTGDFKCRVLTPLDVIIDPYLDHYDDTQWWIIRTWFNKFDLIAAHPELAKQILALDTKDNEFRKFRFVHDAESDLIPVYHFLHNKTAAVPDGKHVIFCDKGVVLHNDVLAYRKPRVYRLAPDDLTGTPFGDSVVFDLLGLQETLDHLYSIVVTNQKTFGIQNIMAPEGSNVSAKQLVGGLNLIKYTPMQGKGPEPLNLTSTPPEIFEFISKIETVLETLSAINSTTRGNAPENAESGSFLALLESRAHAFLSGIVKGIKQLVEEFYHGMIEDFQDFAQVPQKIVLAGKSREYIVKSLVGDDVGNVDMVKVEAVAPNSLTVAAKMDTADKLLERGLIRNAKEYVQVRTTGNIEIVSEKDEKALMLIRKENELLEQGLPAPTPAITDNHLMHIQEHSCVLDDTSIRESAPEVVEQTLQHMSLHIQLLATPDPILQNLLIATGQSPLMLPPMPAETAAGGTPPKPSGSEPTAGAPPEMPSLPTNPGTGQQWDPATGGGVGEPVAPA